MLEPRTRALRARELRFLRGGKSGDCRNVHILQGDIIVSHMPFSRISGHPSLWNGDLVHISVWEQIRALERNTVSRCMCGSCLDTVFYFRNQIGHRSLLP